MKNDPFIPSYKVLGTPIHCADYESALSACVDLAKRNRPCAVSACNTHLVSLARSDQSFLEVMKRFDLVVPDGYPLIWGLNSQGAKLDDRVYGPYLMRHILENTPRPWKHFFFGGTQSTLDKLGAAARQLQPNIDIAGILSPPFRKWTEEDEADFARQIRESGANFIWVALGGERQERWIVKNLHRYPSGVFFAVGDAFELLAGTRPFAPAWMQQRGLTWVYRLWQEPKRLWARYFKFNSLFVYYSMRDKVLGPPKHQRTNTPGKTKIAFLGSRGVPARYSGFEVVVEELGSRLAARGYEVTVYNRYPQFFKQDRQYKGMRILNRPTIPTKSLDTIVHTTICVADALFRGYDLIYLCGVGNALLAGFLQIFGLKVIINVDGADFRRKKWGTFARIWLRLSEQWATSLADRLIADNKEIVHRYKEEHGVEPTYISYGCLIRKKGPSTRELDRWGLKPGGYMLYVSRLTPENEADLLLKAYAGYRGDMPLVICGSHAYERAFYGRLRALSDRRVIFTGARYGDAYVELSQNAQFFIMPAAIEATRLVLLDQMGMGKAILYRDFAATREVLGDTGESFDHNNPVQSLAEKITYLASHPERCKELGSKALARAQKEFSWDAVVAQYEELFAEIGIGGKKSA